MRPQGSARKRLGFGAQAVQGLGFRVWGFGCLGFKGFGVQAPQTPSASHPFASVKGLGLRVKGFGVQGLGFRV